MHFFLRRYWQGTDRQWYLAVFLICLFLKAGFLLIDHTVMLYMGDSMAYLMTALRGEVRWERSTAYGLLLYPLAVWPASFWPVLIAQALGGVCVSLCLTHTLRFLYGVRWPLAAAMGLLLCFDPLQIVHERMVLTESLAQTVFAVYMLALLWYLRRTDLRWLLTSVVLGLLLISLRMVFLPLVLAAPILVILVVPGSRRVRGHHLLMAVALTIVLHGAYRNGMGFLTGGPATYLPDSARFHVSSWAPLLAPEDAEDPVIAGIIRELQIGPHPLSSRSEREFHLWRDTGLVARLYRAYPDPLSAIASAKRLAWRAAWRDPLALVRLSVQTYGDFFQYVVTGRWRVPAETGFWWKYSDEDTALLQAFFGWDATTQGDRSTLSRWYHTTALPYYFGLLLVPWLLLVLAFALRDQRRRACLLCAGVALVYLGVICTLAVVPVVRYLQVYGYLAVLVLGLALDAAVVPWHKWRTRIVR